MRLGIHDLRTSVGTKALHLTSPGFDTSVKRTCGNIRVEGETQDALSLVSRGGVGEGRLLYSPVSEYKPTGLVHSCL